MTEPQQEANVVACLLRADGSAYVVSSKDLDQAFRAYRRRWNEPFLPVAAIEIELESFRSISGLPVSTTRPASVSLTDAARVFGRLGVAPSVRSAFVFHLAKAPAPALLAGWAEAVKVNNAGKVAA